MLKTVAIGNAILVQGSYVETLEDGRIKVRVGKQIYSGMPVQSGRAASAKEPSVRDLAQRHLASACG